jgi:hypothetical protein
MTAPSHVTVRALSAALVLLGAAGCSGGGGSPPTPTGQPPVITSFAANPSWITTGQSATLKWAVTGATNLSIDPIGPLSGASARVTPVADATYTLTASNQFGSTQAQATLAVFQPPSTWFTPLFENDHTPTVGSSDYFGLFSPTASWASAAAHVSVFKMYAGTLDTYDEASLRNMFSDLKRRHIALAIEWGALVSDNGCGNGIEGFGPPGTGLHYAQRIRDLGGTLQYVAFDEPFEFGSIYSGPNACQWTAQQVAQNAAKNVAEIQSIFPDVAVGDIEVVPDNDAPDGWLTAYEQWIDAWQAATGKRLAFFHFDVDWSTQWRPAATALMRALQLRQIPVGHIYNGGGDSDAAWLGIAEAHMTDFETHVDPRPDQANFQSWNPWPSRVLPETDPTAFTYLIDRYFRERTTLSLAVAGGTLAGNLTTSSAPVPNVSVRVTLAPNSGTGQLTSYTASGVLPAGTQYIVFGARIGVENCSSVPLPAEFYLADFTLDAGTAGQLHVDFTNGLTGWGIGGNPAIAQVQGNQLHVQVLPGQEMELGTASLPFAAGGAAYTLTVRATIPPGSRGQGCVIAVYQDQAPTEITRDSLLVTPQPSTLGAVVTAIDGGYQFALGASLPPDYTLWVDYAGSNALWPAAASAIVGHAPLAASTHVLPDGAVGTPYSQLLGASGGMTPYLWVAKGLPPGLTLAQDGTLSGTPMAAGTYAIVTSIIDGSAPPQYVDESLQLIIH